MAINYSKCLMKKQLSRVAYLLFISVLSAALGCSHMTVTYRAKVEADNKESAQFELRKTYDSSAMAWTCGLTAIFYGGACWFYLIKPTGGDRAMIRDEARLTLDSMNLGRFEIVEETFSRPRWSKEETHKNIVFLRGDRGAETASVPQPERRSVTPEEFEKTIVEKPRAGAPARKSEFPSGWPEKWFYETQDYKYWTIVGEKANNSPDAMINSKRKADQVIASEFPNAGNVRYETTHNEIKNVDGRFESWRIIRVRHADVAK